MTPAELYSRHGRDVRSFAARIVRDRADGDEVVSKTFEALPRAMANATEQTDPRSFVMGVCANIARTFRRSEARRRAMIERFAQEPESVRDDDPEAIASRRELLRHVMVALDEMPAEQRNAFLMSAIEDCSASEIAAASGVPEATVRTRIFHARRKLRDALDRASTRSTQRVSRAALVALFVFVVAATAVAAPRMVRVVRAWMGAHASVMAPARPLAVTRERTDRPTVVPAPVERPVVAAARPDAPSAVDPPASPLRMDSSSRRRRPPRVASTAASATPEEFEPTYLEAHRLHFVEHDYGAAIEAWRTYLSTAPNGRLAPEARYNIAIALARLHRWSEARAALAPFADGRAGGYRQSEATHLLELFPAD